jgi:hypothetical protein
MNRKATAEVIPPADVPMKQTNLKLPVADWERLKIYSIRMGKPAHTLAAQAIKDYLEWLDRRDRRA